MHDQELVEALCKGLNRTLSSIHDSSQQLASVLHRDHSLMGIGAVRKDSREVVLHLLVEQGDHLLCVLLGNFDELDALLFLQVSLLHVALIVPLFVIPLSLLLIKLLTQLVHFLLKTCFNLL